MHLKREGRNLGIYILDKQDFVKGPYIWKDDMLMLVKKIISESVYMRIWTFLRQEQVYWALKPVVERHVERPQTHIKDEDKRHPSDKPF
jgi:hypothetical protein